jgi:glutamate synthase domain-containing protein 2
MRLPIFTGALGSTDIARRNWEGLAVGAAISGISLVVGENVCGVDPAAEFSGGKVRKSPELKKRVGLYRQWAEGYGDIVIQLNVEDTRFGVAEYAVGELGVETIELKWGQGAKCIGGEIKVDSLERALELQRRGYLVTPDPSDPASQQAFRDGEIAAFERHSRLGFISEEAFLSEVARIRKLGAKRVTLKTGAYGARELAMALKWSSKAGVDLVTIDGASGGTGMSPWRMMNEWGIPTFYLQALACQFAGVLASRGERVPDLAMAGGFSTEDHIFKVLAMGAPYFKAVCMGRALMIPGFVAKNIELWHKTGKLPATISKYGSKPEEVFYYWDELKNKYGQRFASMPMGAIGVYSFAKKLQVGLQQLMAGARKFNVPAISRADVFALTREAAEVSGLPYVMDAGREAAMAVLNS